MYFITKSTLQPKNKLHTAIQQHIMGFHQTITSKTAQEIKAHFEAVLQRINAQHSRCAPVNLHFNDNRDYNGNFGIGFGDEANLSFSQVKGTVESNFNVQTQI